MSFPRPYSLGCLINHYQPSLVPNVTYFEATVPLDSSSLPLLPYIYSDGTLPIRDGVARVVVMLALRDIENEELLADYSFVAFYSSLSAPTASHPV